MFKNLIIVTICVVAFSTGCSKRPEPVVQNEMKSTPQETPTIAEEPAEGIDESREPASASARATPPSKEFVVSEGGPNMSLRPPLMTRVVPPDSKPKLDPVLESTRRRLVSELDAAKLRGSNTTDVFRKFWSESWIAAFDEALPKAQDPRIESGEFLPPEVAVVKASRDQALKQIMTGTFPYAKDPEEIEAAGAMMMVGMAQGMGGGRHFPGMLWSRANELPPTKGDLIAYAVVSAAVREATGDQSALENWRPLMEAKNPIYRLLALEAARYAFPAEARSLPSESPKTSDVVGAQRLGFYREYLRETDPLIVATVIDAVAKVGSPDARKTLEEMRAQQTQLGNHDLVARTEKAVAEVDRIISYRTPQPEK